VLFNGLQCIQVVVLETPYQQLSESFFCYKPVPANLTCIISLTKKVTYQVITFFACLSATIVLSTNTSSSSACLAGRTRMRTSIQTASMGIRLPFLLKCKPLTYTDLWAGHSPLLLKFEIKFFKLLIRFRIPFIH
jgi:hypothetical protein